MKEWELMMEKQHEQFTSYARIHWIFHEMRANRYPNTRTIAEKFGVTRKTAQRTLDFMQDQLRSPIAYSAAHRGWYCTQADYTLPDLNLTQGELIGILLAEKFARAYVKTALGMQIEQAIKKVLMTMDNVISVDFNALVEAYSFESAVVSEVDIDILRLLAEAIKKRKRMKMTYFTANTGRISEREVDALHLRNYLGEWYLIAFDHLRQAIRDFHVGRIRELKMTEIEFQWPSTFDLSAYLDAGFGMIRGSQVYEVIIDFDEYQARWMRARSPVHPTEIREELPDGGMRIAMKVTALDSVKRFVMQYGAHVCVVSPPELRAAVQKEITAMYALYKDAGSLNYQTSCDK